MSKAHVYSNDIETPPYFPNLMSVYFRTPMTDIFSQINTHQQYSTCGKFELQMMECMEAYGSDKGRLKCSDYIDDFHECTKNTKTFLRLAAMDAERRRQVKAGTIKYATPPVSHAY